MKDFEDIKFDIVIFHNSIHHLYDNKITNKNSVNIFDPNGGSIVENFLFGPSCVQKITFNKINIDGIYSKQRKKFGISFKKNFKKLIFLAN